MATTYKILGQKAPGASWTDLYTAGSAASAIISTVVICNTSAANRTFRLGVVPATGVTPTTSGSLAYDSLVPANDSIVLTLGVTLAANNSLRCYGSTTDVGFSAFGAEIT